LWVEVPSSVLEEESPLIEFVLTKTPPFGGVFFLFLGFPLPFSLIFFPPPFWRTDPLVLPSPPFGKNFDAARKAPFSPILPGKRKCLFFSQSSSRPLPKSQVFFFQKAFLSVNRRFGRRASFPFFPFPPAISSKVGAPFSPPPSRPSAVRTWKNGFFSVPPPAPLPPFPSVPLLRFLR